MDIKWEDPGPRNRKGATGKWAGIAAELKKRPGQWALVAENVFTSAAVSPRNHGLEVTCRNVKNNRAEKMYARWPEDAS